MTKEELESIRNEAVRSVRLIEVRDCGKFGKLIYVKNNHASRSIIVTVTTSWAYNGQH